MAELVYLWDSLSSLQSKIAEIVKILRRRYRPFFRKENPFRVLIGTILSHRTKDETTRAACERLFAFGKSPKDFAKMKIEKIQSLIKPVGFWRVKAKRIKEISKMLLEKYRGEVPTKLNELLSLPGVGAKTAACVLLYGYGLPTIPVDVHVAVISRRLSLTEKQRPEEIQEDLQQKIPRKYWKDINELFVQFGQDFCKTRNPKCTECPIKNFCKFLKTK